MATDNKSTIEPKKEMSKTYDSNPFTLTFNALGRFFNTNVNWAIVVIALAVISFFGQAVSDLVRFISEGSLSDEPPDFSQFSSGSSADPAVVIAVVIVVFSLAVMAIVFTSIIGAFINGMFSYVALKSEAGKTVGFSEAFNATMKRFWRLLLAQLLANLKIFGWTLLFIIPGIIAGYRFQLLPYLIMSESEKEKGVGDSHDKTKALVKGRLWELFGISFVAGIVPFVGSLLGLSGKASFYNQLRATSHAPEKRPKIHWLNFVGLIVGGALLILGFMLVLFITLVIVANN
jgi:uncharacterized membrane protein